MRSLTFGAATASPTTGAACIAAQGYSEYSQLVLWALTVGYPGYSQWVLGALPGKVRCAHEAQAEALAAGTPGA
jgi:hypothetical protein